MRNLNWIQTSKSEFVLTSEQQEIGSIKFDIQQKNNATIKLNNDSFFVTKQGFINPKTYLKSQTGDTIAEIYYQNIISNNLLLKCNDSVYKYSKINFPIPSLKIIKDGKHYVTLESSNSWDYTPYVFLKRNCNLLILFIMLFDYYTSFKKVMKFAE